MPVDPSVLMKYDPRQPPPKPRRSGLAALLVAGIGSLIALVLFLFADGDADLGRAFIIGTVILGVGSCAVLVFLGFQEDGLSGMLYAYRHPLGSEFSGEGPPSWMRLAWAWVLVLAMVLSFVIGIHSPGAIPWNWSQPRPSPQRMHDAFLK
jgi:hypothetical protein